MEVSITQTQVHVEEETASKSVEDHVFNTFYDSSLPFGIKLIHGIMLPFMLPALLVGVVLAVPVTLLLLPIVGVQSIASAFKDAKKKSTYDKDRAKYVRIMSQKFVARVATYEALEPFVEGQLKLALNTLNDLQARIPTLIEADVKLCQQLLEESQSKKDTVATSLVEPNASVCAVSSRCLVLWKFGACGSLGMTSLGMSARMST